MTEKITQVILTIAILVFSIKLFVKGYKDKGYIEVSEDPNTYTEEQCNELFGEVKTNGC